MPHRRSSPSRSVAVGTNPERTRSHNRRVVLETVRQHGRLGRSDIAALTRLTAQAVSNIVAELVGEGFLIEQGRRRTARGQPPMELAVNADGGMTAGMEIAADHITTVLVDLAGEVRAQRIVPLGDSALEAVQALAAAELALARTGTGLPRRLLGCGVVMPGPFEIEGMSSVGSSPCRAGPGMMPAGSCHWRCRHPSRSRTTRRRPPSASICTGWGGICGISA